MLYKFINILGEKLNMKKETTRINMNLSDELLAKVDNFAAENCVNRSAAINVIISTYFRQNDAMEAMTKAIALMEKEYK